MSVLLSISIIRNITLFWNIHLAASRAVRDNPLGVYLLTLVVECRLDLLYKVDTHASSLELMTLSDADIGTHATVVSSASFWNNTT